MVSGRRWADEEVVRALGGRGPALLARWREVARDVDPGAAWRSLAASDVEVVLRGAPGYPRFSPTTSSRPPCSSSGATRG